MDGKQVIYELDEAAGDRIEVEYEDGGAGEEPRKVRTRVVRDRVPAHVMYRYPDGAREMVPIGDVVGKLYRGYRWEPPVRTGDKIQWPGDPFSWTFVAGLPPRAQEQPEARKPDFEPPPTASSA